MECRHAIELVIANATDTQSVAQYAATNNFLMVAALGHLSFQ
jgi:hypothetical protein